MQHKSILVWYLTKILASVKATSSLKLSGDIELNPGPYEILRSVQGSFNQGNAALFGETAAR